MISIQMRFVINFLVLFNLSQVSAHFEADVRWTCGQNVVSVFVQTPQPFDGVVQTRSSSLNAADDERNDPCRIQGIGTNVAVLKLKLTSDGECGMKFDEATKTFHTIVDVHSHPVLIVEGDKSVNITCQQRSSNQTFDEENLEMRENLISPDYELRILSSRLPIDTVKYSKPYTLQIRQVSRNDKSVSGFFVGQCVAQPVDGNVTVQLTDSVGCALFKSIMSDFSRRESVEEAEIPSMFRFPEAKLLKFSCVIIECDGNCETRSCHSAASASSLLERTTTSVESEDVQKVSLIVKINDGNVATVASRTTTVLPTTEFLVDDRVLKVMQQDSETPPPNLIVKQDGRNRREPTSIQCVSEYEFKLLYYLCIFLAICSIIGFTMNIILCYMLRRKSSQKRKKLPISVEQIQISKKQTNQPDFWIAEGDGIPPTPSQIFARQDSISSYSSFRKPLPRRSYPPSSEYGIPIAATRSSAASSSDDRNSNEVYRRPNPSQLHRPEVRNSNSTFMTHSTTMETDMDSQGSSNNQASSYH